MPNSHWAELGAAHGRPTLNTPGDWDQPDCALWVARLDACISSTTEPVVLIAHSLGGLTIAHWGRAHPQRHSKIHAAWLAAVPDPQRPNFPSTITGYTSLPMQPLPFPSLMVISSNDPYARLDRSEQMAQAWQAEVWHLSNAGHINTASGHGAWPEGFARLQHWLAR